MKQAIRIALLLAIIFAAGVITGRLTAPRPPASAVLVGGRVGTSEGFFARLNRDLHLSAEQERQFRPLIEDMVREMGKTQPATRERLAKFQSYVPRMKALLQPEQSADFERYVRDTETRFKRAIRARAQQHDAPP